MIELKGVSKTYRLGRPNAVEALREVSFSVEAGELVAVTGASGAGKSTLLHVLACIDRFDSGDYRLNGRSVAGLGDRAYSCIRNKEVGIVLQDFALIEEYSVIQNVMTPLFFSDIRRNRERRKRAEAALEAVGISELKNADVREISGGQKQRAAIARAMVNRPAVLLADEPTGALDSETSAGIMRLFARLRETGQTILIVTHDPVVAAACPRTLHMRDGRLSEKTDEATAIRS